MKLTLYEQETICLFNEAEALAEEEDVVDALFQLADEEKLDKEKVDAATAYDLEDENELVEETDKLSQEELDAKNKEFMKSIGLDK